jgi:hypothetical protein
MGVVAGWEREVARPLRAMRRHLRSKTGPISVAESWELHHKARDLEVEAQRVAQAALQALPAPPAGPNTAVETNLALYLVMIGHDPALAPEIERLGAASVS